MAARCYPSLEERFWSKVDKSEGCWLWTAGLNRKGYGVIVKDRKARGAHLVSYEMANGPIPKGQTVDHRYTCPKRCVNPEHLRLATTKQQRENLAGPQVNNASGVRGVMWAPRQRRWKATVGHHGKHVHVGYFLRIEDAEAAVTRKRLELFTHNELDRISQC